MLPGVRWPDPPGFQDRDPSTSSSGSLSSLHRAVHMEGRVHQTNGELGERGSKSSLTGYSPSGRVDGEACVAGVTSLHVRTEEDFSEPQHATEARLEGVQWLC